MSEDIIATYAARITIRGTGTAPTIAELEEAIEKAVTELGGVSRGNTPLISVNADATRTDQ